MKPRGAEQFIIVNFLNFLQSSEAFVIFFSLMNSSNSSTNSPNPGSFPPTGAPGRFPGQTHPPWDSSFGPFPWPIASTSAAAAATAIEAAYFASAGQNFHNSSYPPGDLGYPWASQWTGMDSRWSSRFLGV